MNIIIHRYNSICEPDFIDAFKAVGLDVIEDIAEMQDKSLDNGKKAAILYEMIAENAPLFVFSINFYPYISMVCEKLGVMYVCVSVDCPVVELFSETIKNKCNRVFLFDYKQYKDVHKYNPECIFYMPLGVNVNRINETIGEPDFENIEYKYDVSFIGSLYNEHNPFPEMYENLSDRYRGMCDGLLAAQELFNGQILLENAVSDELVSQIKNAAKDFYVADYMACDVDKFVAINHYLSKELTVRDRLNLMYMLGNTLNGLEMQMAEAGTLGSAKVHLFTRSDLSELKAAKVPLEYHGGVRTLDEMPQIFRTSKININPTMRSIQSGLPQRIWDVIGSGGFLLTNYQADLPEYFEIGKHIAAYESIEEACEKCAYYLTHEEERMEIARNGYELAKAKHTIIHRVTEIIKTISR